jgi:hypothetical protein
MASLPNNHESSLRTPPTGGLINLNNASREYLIDEIINLRRELREANPDVCDMMMKINDQANEITRLREKLARIHNESRT